MRSSHLPFIGQDAARWLPHIPSGSLHLLFLQLSSSPRPPHSLISSSRRLPLPFFPRCECHDARLWGRHSQTRPRPATFHAPPSSLERNLADWGPGTARFPDNRTDQSFCIKVSSSQALPFFFHTRHLQVGLATDFPRYRMQEPLRTYKYSKAEWTIIIHSHTHNPAGFLLSKGHDWVKKERLMSVWDSVHKKQPPREAKLLRPFLPSPLAAPRAPLATQAYAPC